VGKLDPLIRRQRAAAVAGLTTWAEHVLGEAQRQVPLEEGTLGGTGSVEIHQRPGGADAVISFGTPYAARQHEELGYRHRNGRKAKYLEDPMKANLPRLGPVLQASIDRAT
jgi:hypothetical protein